MKSQPILKIFHLIFVLGLLAILSSSAYAAETYKLDPAHTSIVFRVKHLGIAYVYGRINGPTGTFVFDESSPSKSSTMPWFDLARILLPDARLAFIHECRSSGKTGACLSVPLSIDVDHTGKRALIEPLKKMANRR